MEAEIVHSPSMAAEEGGGEKQVTQQGVLEVWQTSSIAKQQAIEVVGVQVCFGPSTEIGDEEKHDGSGEAGHCHIFYRNLVQQVASSDEDDQGKRQIYPARSEPREPVVVLGVDDVVQKQVAQEQRRKRHNECQPAALKSCCPEQANGGYGREIVRVR